MNQIMMCGLCPSSFSVFESSPVPTFGEYFEIICVYFGIKRREVERLVAKLRIIPLGGLGEIGKNMTAFEYGDDIVVVDCG